ncbi:hypothetical protein GTA08_BOTSDO11557 [Neofusicoccum parvum]|uniref:Uncharacterized protein n=1 Tax=Neofusicoccum parvum TaxID=310453 RepID=A0ACB5S4R4_9PEZI|nr:hypothetical protein GTA08_BOTSDO11557 [Neofusicoccum parvum]
MTVNGDHAVGQLVEQLTIGFDTLSSEYRILYDRHRELENKLAWAKQQYLDLLKRFTPDIALQDHKVAMTVIAGLAPTSFGKPSALAIS